MGSLTIRFTAVLRQTPAADVYLDAAVAGD